MGAGAVVVLEALDAVLINELPRGWAWGVAAGVVVLVAAAVTGWMAVHSASSVGGVVLGAGSVRATIIDGSVETWADVPGNTPHPEPGEGVVLGPGSVSAERINGPVRTWARRGRPPGAAR